MFRWLRREPKQLIERQQALSPALMDYYPLYKPPHRQGSFLRRRHDQTEDEYIRHRRAPAGKSRPDHTGCHALGHLPHLSLIASCR